MFLAGMILMEQNLAAPFTMIPKMLAKIMEIHLKTKVLWLMKHAVVVVVVAQQVLHAMVVVVVFLYQLA
jgi:hypothetical protein